MEMADVRVYGNGWVDGYAAQSRNREIEKLVLELMERPSAGSRGRGLIRYLVGPRGSGKTFGAQ
jgi:pantothenate kinase-related protein Tda10